MKAEGNNSEQKMSTSRFTPHRPSPDHHKIPTERPFSARTVSISCLSLASRSRYAWRSVESEVALVGCKKNIYNNHFFRSKPHLCLLSFNVHENRF
jgi:hypothetical protein